MTVWSRIFSYEMKQWGEAKKKFESFPFCLDFSFQNWGKSDYKGWTPAELPFDTYCVHDLDGTPKRYGLELEFNFIIISHVTSTEQQNAVSIHPEVL